MILLTIKRLSLLLAALIWAGASYSGQVTPELAGMVSKLGANKSVPVIIRFGDRLNLEEFTRSKIKNGVETRKIRRGKLIRALRDKTGLTQREIRKLLKQRGIGKLKDLWLINGLALDLPVHMIDDLAMRPEVETIQLDTIIPKPVTRFAAPATSAWNLTSINVPALWTLGLTGNGVVVASMDSGVDIAHNAIAAKYRGGSNSWLDPYGEHATPFDYDGHGTQTMGLMTADPVAGQHIGIAPGTQWISVKIFNDADTSSLSAIHQGYQWLLDPDSNPGTDDAPDIVNNSWGLLNIGVCNQEFQLDVDALRAAEIAVVFAAGNSGSNPNSDTSPANYVGIPSVGAVDQNMSIWTNSSRGPSACDQGIFPKLSAPGVGVQSTDITLGGFFPNALVSVTGTSFSAPHVAGVYALLREAFPFATVTQIDNALFNSASDLGAVGPDDNTGYGLVDGLAAYNLLLGGIDNDNDGFASGVDCNDSDPAIKPGAPETKHDGIDQDCNGYDLTIDIAKAKYRTKKDVLVVVATSSLGASANLSVQGYGAMKWLPGKQKWQLRVRSVGGPPLVPVSVVGVEGTETRAVNRK